MEELKNLLSNMGMPRVLHVSYFVEIFILAFIIYELLIWVKNTRAFTLLKGIIAIGVFVAFCYILNLTTLTWIISKTAGVFVTMLIILFQPEIRRALEQLGRRLGRGNVLGNFFGSVLNLGDSRTADDEASFNEQAIGEIVDAAFAMGEKKTGALMVVQRQVLLNEYERTGIELDALVSCQLLINIFEKNTPLHDGAVFISGSRITAATCYLPLSENMNLAKSLGTRHRAAVGVSEISDSVTVIVSEETGDVSVAEGGRLSLGLTREELAKRLALPEATASGGHLDRLKGMIRYGRKADT